MYNMYWMYDVMLFLFYKKPDKPPKVCLKLTPLQSVVAKEVHARVDLIVQYTADYPNR